LYFLLVEGILVHVEFVISKKIGRNFYFINTRIFGKISVFFKEKLYICRKLSG